MQKKIILAGSTFLMAAAAYLVFSHGDRPNRPAESADAVQAVRRFVSLPTTQGTQPISDSNLTFSPGDHTRVRVYDDKTGRLKYQFEAERWEPVGSDNDFHVESLLIQIFTPRGEITYINADQADVRIVRKTKNRVEAQHGRLWGHVKVAIDRTTAQWREEHPKQATRQAHPEAMINIDMEAARFDMDRAELISDGPVVVDSREARLEKVSDLTVHWNLQDNRIEVLRFERGGRMVIRSGAGMFDFALPGATRKSKRTAHASNAGDNAKPGAALTMKVPRAQANQPKSIQAITAEEAVAEIRLAGGTVVANRPKSIQGAGRPTAGPTRRSARLRTPEALAKDLATMQTEARSGRTGPGATTRPGMAAAALPAKRVHTYRAIFNNEVIVEQLDAGRRVGRLEADKLEVHFDLTSRQRAFAGGAAADKKQTAKTKVTSSVDDGPLTPETALVAPTNAVDRASEDSESRLILTWNGPFELRPLQTDPTQPQSGKRFDVIATGRPVRVHSEQGDTTCGQLVYRHEGRQVWLSGTKAAPVEMSAGDSRRLVGREVFFDQRRGLAKVEGAGRIVDLRGNRLDLASAGAASAEPRPPRGSGATSQKSDAESKPREPVEIRWARGVDLELGLRRVPRFDPQTGTMRYKDKEYLRRAWFHGDVFFQQGDERLSAREVAVTFGVPRSDGEVADYIEHLNMAGAVRLERGDDLIQAERLDVDMILTPGGRNVPRKVDATGRVLARQLRRVIRAAQMHVVLAEYPGKMKLAPDGKTPIPGRPFLGIDSLDAGGNVLVADPQHNLKVSRAQSLKVALRNGNELVRATILSTSSKVLARARYGELAIHGHRIEIDTDRQSVDVPGPGKAWMLTNQDFGGRKLTRPTPVKTTWTGHMKLRLAQDYGVFVDNVRSSSAGFLMNCDKLTIRFARFPPAPKKTKKGLLERFFRLGAIHNDRAELQITTSAASAGTQKRPAYVIAEGKAEAMSSTYAPRGADGRRGRLLSRARVAGQQIVVDLRREQMSVPGAGTLLIEDYQLPRAGGGGGVLGAPRVGGPLMSSVRSDGPSQTLLTWQNSMDLFVDRGLVAFDKDVRMVHRSGQKMVLKEELGRAMNLDASVADRVGTGRETTLSCAHLLLEFRSGPSGRRGRSTKKEPLIRATDLQRLIARGTVSLQDGTKSLMGEYLQYLHDTNEVRLEGSATLEARIIDQDEDSQRLSMWRGPLLVWDRNSNRIESVHAHIRTSSG